MKELFVAGGAGVLLTWRSAKPVVGRLCDFCENPIPKRVRITKATRFCGKPCREAQYRREHPELKARERDRSRRRAAAKKLRRVA